LTEKSYPASWKLHFRFYRGGKYSCCATCVSCALSFVQ